ncbi:hypothetical protein ACVJBD_000463 [Rhizobium mongolense]
MFLDYFALGVVLVFVVVILFYAVIAIHDIPHLMATARNHPDHDAIHVAGWVRPFTLHAIWPFLFYLGNDLPQSTPNTGTTSQFSGRRVCA